MAKVERIKRHIPFPHDSIPSVFLRTWMTLLNLCETRTYLYIADHTWGYQKEWDAISWSQMVHGQVAKSGEPVDLGTGFSRPTIEKALCRLQEFGLIRVIKRGSRLRLYALTHPNHIAEEAERYRLELENSLETTVA